MLAPLLTALSLVPGDHSIGTVSSTHGLLVGAAMLVAALFLHLSWRISGDASAAWLALLLSCAAVPGLALAALSLTHPEVVQAQAGWIFVTRVLFLGALIATLLASRVYRLRPDPLAAGLVAGLLVALLRHLVLVEAPPLHTPDDLAVLRALVLGGFAAALSLAVLRLDGLAHRVRARISLALLLIGVGSPSGGLVALGTGVVGGALLAGTAAALLHEAIETEKRHVHELHQRLEAVEAGIRADRARLHEIDATVAGIASAQKLMSEGLAADRSAALGEMVRAEIERLQRLVAARAPVAQRRSVDLDDVIGQIVLSHLARGRVVVWEPTGLRALGRADDIAEVVNVLLENAAVHGGSDTVAVGVTRATGEADDPEVTITVSDRGPGIPVELRERVFDWGFTRADSPGQGIGLHVAADITHELGGLLELVPSLRGATFAIHLPAAHEEMRVHERVARAS